MTAGSSRPTGRRPLILHPLLLAMYVVLAPLAENIDIVGRLAVRSMVIALVSVTLLLVVLRIMVRDALKAALVTSGAIILFASFGHASRVLETAVFLSGWAKGVLLAAWLGLMGAWAFWVLKRSRSLTVWNGYGNTVAVILLAFPLIRILTYTRSTPVLRARVGDYRSQFASKEGLADLVASSTSPTPMPDIYYVILDAYGLGDLLSDLYQFDNTAFLEDLAQRGFYVPDRSCSNYPETVPSLASSLNMAQLRDAPEALRPWVDTDQEEILRDAYGLLMQQNLVAEFLRAHNYEWVVFDSGYDRTSATSADVFDRAPGVPSFDAGSAFEMMVLDTTLWQAYLDLRGQDYVPFRNAFDHHRARVRYAATHLSDYADRPGPQFVFAHIISPHTPYVFGRNGEPVTETAPFTLLDQFAITEWDPAPYLDQVTFISSLILREVDEILAKSDTDPIIVLQADHGSRVGTQPDPPPETLQQLLYPTFAAYHLPPGRSEWNPYPTMTPVNLFRVLLNRYFGTELALLPDENLRLMHRNGHLVIEEACLSLGGCGVTESGAPTVGLPTCR
ncbi:MAG: hypothetical protein A2W26_02265 [Acidobacteria bacterium RBG_16_64_8]|nr:MAG: hypothetical protein A2W26_02265 [Acidobacteria bacterium RBG_16_64_8]